MHDHTSPTRNAALDPANRIAEILFGLIMVLTFTSSMRATDVIRDDVREMLFGALGCNLAWGIIDAFMYLMGVAAERGREDLLIQKIKVSSIGPESRELLREVLPESFGESLTEVDLDRMHESISSRSILPRARLLMLSDLRAALTVFALVFVTTFPVTIPFMFVGDTWKALRLSNFIALLLLIGLGSKLGKYSGRSPRYCGIGMALIGILLVAIAVSFGG